MPQPIPIYRGLAWHGVPFKGTKAQYSQALRIFSTVFPAYSLLDLVLFTLERRLDFIAVGFLAIFSWWELRFVVRTGRYYAQGIGQYPMDIIAFYLIGFSYVSLILFALTPYYFSLSILQILLANAAWLLRGVVGKPPPEVLKEARRFYRGRTSKKYLVYVIAVSLFSFQALSVALGERCTVEGTNCVPVYASLTEKVLYSALAVSLWTIVIGWPEIAKKVTAVRKSRLKRR